jgi:hypothetical protein
MEAAPTAARHRKPRNRRREIAVNQGILMWLPKSSHDISAEKRCGPRRQLRTVIALWVVMSIVILVTPPTRDPFSIWYGLHLPLQGAIPRKVAVPFVTIMLILVSWWWFRRCGSEPASTWICPKCEAVKTPDGNPECKCGGKFVDMNTVKWVK